MNRIKRACALLLTVVLTASVVLQSGIGEVYAENKEQPEQTTVAEAEPVDDSTEKPEAEPVDDSTEEPEAEPVDDSIEEPEADSTDEPAVEPAVEQAAESTTNPTVEPAADAYIYFDLAAGNVTIGADSYSGYVYVGNEAREVSGLHATGNKYYVYQSNPGAVDSSKAHPKNTGYASENDYQAKQNCRVPEYSRVRYDGKLWKDYITNNTKVEDEVIKNWGTAAAAVGRTGTSNYINFNAGAVYDVTIDDIWSTKHEHGTGRSSGGIQADLGDSGNTDIQLRLKGDSRVGNIHYYSNATTNYLQFFDGEGSSTPGSITVATYDKNDNLNGNYWNAAIGGSDNRDNSKGIVINSGVIYAGTTRGDNCTAIGGGGNGYGVVTIHGGTVTAVAATTGTAIGGGIGWNAQGGDANVTIDGGTVYAYNLGVGEDSPNAYSRYVPAVAIGGGSSENANGNGSTSVTISGGTVYAQSMSGAAIGGGGSSNKNGGNANISISGGTIIAKSVGGSVTYKKKEGPGTEFNHKWNVETEEIPAGVSIGGGTGHLSGGSVTLDISGSNTKLRTGSIGGGYCTGSGKIGSANVVISGGDITGQVIMAGTGDMDNTCSFTMSGGKIHSTNLIDGNTIHEEGITDPRADIPILYLEKNGGAVWMQDPYGVTDISGGTIEGCTAEQGGAVYMEGGSFTLSGTGTISGNTAKRTVATETSAETGGMGGGVYITGGDAHINGGNISKNYANYRGGGIFLTKSPILTAGTISGNTAGNSGGGLCISGDSLELNSANMQIFGNEATENGGGVAVLNGSFILNGGAVGVENKTPNKAKNGGGVYVEAENSATAASATVSSGNIWYNKAENGGGIYLAKGEGIFTLDGEDAIVSHNEAKNGGGIYLYRNPDLRHGKIVQNNATENGGGMYISDCVVTLKPEEDVFITDNQAKRGGGVAVMQGKFTMESGSLANNIATESGGGAYVAGEFHMLGGTIGGDGAGNHAKDGGGVYVANGDVTIVNGEISHNSASNNGGGFLVSASEGDVKVVMLSGKLNNNTAEKNGGGMAVESHNEKVITVEIGCLLDHKIIDGNPDLPIEYDGDYSQYAKYYDNSCKHEKCPEVQYNRAGKIGGGFYMNSDSSSLYFFCVEETHNTAQNTDSEGMDVEGGKVSIGDHFYHNHEYNEGHSDNHREDGPWGYIAMDDTTLVNGGQVDIYGDMTNPAFRKEIMVDIIDKENDYFLDHRRAQEGEKIYKVHYFENFQGTGRFESRDYHADETVITVKGALFSHPGYKILGWYTKDSYNPAAPDEGHKFYQVGESFDLADPEQVPQMGRHPTDCNQCGESNPDLNLLVLYAIWEANGYTVVFDPNVPPGETYTGSMNNQIHQYDATLALTPNEYSYPGHIFGGWNTQADGEGVSYTDGQEVTNLTDKNGVEVVLYAQWTPCDHDTMGERTYEVSKDKKTLLRICSCGGQTLTATLNAEDTVYNGKSHPATLTLDDEKAWGGDAPTIQYEGVRLKEEDIKYGELKFEDDEGAPVDPYHAGNYTASITKYNGENPVTALVTYTIAKADQEAPVKPSYTVPDEASGTKVLIDKLEKDTYEFKDDAEKTHTAKAEYCLTYYDAPGIEWQKFPDDGTTTPLEIGLNNAYTNYIVAARYEELEDYNASDITRADAVYFFAGNVKVVIICDEGIDYKFAPTDGNDPTTNGAVLTLALKTGYYRVGSDYNVEATLKLDSSETASSHPVTKVDGKEDEYSIKNITTDSTLTIHIGKAKKSPLVKAQAMPGQKFSPFTGGTTIDISRDSAFTAAFQISNFDPAMYGVPELTFGLEIPAKTAIILLDRADGTYWYYRAESVTNAGSSVSLGDFREMGGDGTKKYSVPVAGANGYVDLSYQFIEDFSQCADSSNITGGCSGGNVEMTLEAPLKGGNAAKAPNVRSSVRVAMKDSGFTFEKTKTEGLTNSFKCTFKKGADASKWENRASALILEPRTDTDTAATLPPDAQIKAEVADSGTTYLYKSGDSFIVPLSLLEDGYKDVTLTLQSALFPADEKSYTFTARWLISPSGAGKAPMTGDQAGTMNDVVFTFAKRVVPSLKATGEHRILSSGDTLEVKIEKRNMEGYNISAELLRKSVGEKYEGIGWNESNVSANSVRVTLGGYSPGGYCMMFTVKKSGDDSITTVMEVPYYFVVKETR